MPSQALSYVMKSMDSLQTQLKRRDEEDMRMADSLEVQSFYPSNGRETFAQGVARATSLLLQRRDDSEADDGTESLAELRTKDRPKPIIPGVSNVNSIYLRGMMRETQILIDKLHQVRR